MIKNDTSISREEPSAQFPSSSSVKLVKRFLNHSTHDFLSYGEQVIYTVQSNIQALANTHPWEMGSSSTNYMHLYIYTLEQQGL